MWRHRSLESSPLLLKTYPGHPGRGDRCHCYRIIDIARMQVVTFPSFQANSKDPLAKVPLDIQLRARWRVVPNPVFNLCWCRQVFTGVLKYPYELLTLDTFMKLPGDLQVMIELLCSCGELKYTSGEPCL